MREIKPRLTRELDAHCNDAPVWRAPAFEVTTYRALVEHVARLAYANPDELLFFRGQDKDYQSKAGGTTLYPAIYRSDVLAARELRHRKLSRVHRDKPISVFLPSRSPSLTVAASRYPIALT
jgi:hypothetical protein